MSTGPHTSLHGSFTPPPTGPTGQRGGRGTTLLLGGIAFAAVFLLIVGATVTYLVVRGTGSGPANAGAATTSSAPGEETTEPAGDESTEPSSSPSVEAQRCWRPEYQRTSTNPSGRLRGGGLEFIPPGIYDSRGNNTRVEFLNDAQSASAHVEADWYSTLIVGAVEWQPGIEYPGERAASEKILSCVHANAAIWGDTSGRTLHDQITEPVTIAGMPGYRTSATLKFAKHNLTKTDAEAITVTVVATPEGPSAFVTMVGVGLTDHQEGAEAAFDSLTGLSG